MKSAMVFLGVMLLAGGVLGDSSLLFKATFDGYNTKPDFAASGKVTPGGIQQDLQMRMDQGEVAMKNVVSLQNPEYISYPIAGNFRPDRGTVSFWMKPSNYNLADVKTYQMGFTANGPNYEFYIYKYTQRPNMMLFYLFNGEERHFVRGTGTWREGDWHKIDVTWDPNEMAIYIDGVQTDRLKLEKPMKLPRALKGGRMTLNCQQGFNPTVDGRETAYDNLEIHDRKLTAKEIFENYKLVRPNAKPTASVDTAPEPPRLTYQCIPNDKKLVVKLDLWAVDLKSRENVPVNLSLVNRANNQATVKAAVVFKDSDASVDFAFGDKLVEGETYDLVAEIPAAKVASKVKFHVPDMSFLKVRAGVDGTVPVPWTPIKVEENDHYSINDRTYTFARGILPTSIICRGEEMLTEAPRFEWNDMEVVWQKATLVERHDDHVVLSAKGEVQGMAVCGKAELWFDGFCQLQIRFTPGEKPRDVSSLKLKWSVPADAARYLLTPCYRAWQAGNRYDGTFGYDEYDQDQFLWTTGIEKGLCWWCDSRANWVGETKAKTIHVVRGEKQADVSIDIIAESVTLKKDAEYTMGFQATPAKRPNRDDRYRSYSACGSFGDWTTGGWNITRDPNAPDNIENWISYVPQNPKAFGAYMKKRRKEGLDTLIYGMHSVISVRDDPWDYFNATWSRLPLVREAIRIRGEFVSIYFGCGMTGIADWHVGNIENLFKTQPDLKGVYFDISDVKFCNNTLHGHGGVDAFGQTYRTSTALGTRDYFMRIYKVCRRYDRWLQVHAHNKYYPFAHTFADACWPGEEQYYAVAADPENHYLEGIGEEEYQAAWNPVIRGMDVYLIPQNRRASDYGEYKNQPELFMGDRSVSAAMIPSLLYDFKNLGGAYGKGDAYADAVYRKLIELPLRNATFHGYWYDPHAQVAKGVRTALYTWNESGKPGFLLVVANTSRQDLKTALKLDWAKAGVSPRALTDIRTGVTQTEAAWAASTLESHMFLLLCPQKE